LLGGFARKLAERGTRFEVVLVPTREQAEESHWHRLIASGHIVPGRDDRFALNEALAAALRKEGVRVLDLGPDFASASQGGEHNYFELDRHWTPDGHDLAARIIVRELF
jgi:hypothetical protein